jgi:glycosyltransferase involved in cell wall biosynthesis
MTATAKVAVVIPCYRERERILAVIEAVPARVERIYVIDDCCPEDTGTMVEAECGDPRVAVLRHEKNKGVGAATVTGYRAALAGGADIVVKIDGDGQMDPTLIGRFILPVESGQADYAKGNRFYHLEDVTTMPGLRLVGNAALSFMNKLSTGYWRIFDPTNGYTAIHAKVIRLLPLDRLAERYFFETDMLFRLALARAVVLDVPVRARYAGERSDLRIGWSVPVFLAGHAKNFLKRLFYNYFLRDFSVASVEWILGPSALLFGVIFGTYKWTESIGLGVVATAGTVMLAALPTIIGLQFILSALSYDMENQPRIPVHPLLEDGDEGGRG